MAALPWLPMRLPLYSAPAEWAASSMILIFFPAIAFSASRSAGAPAKWTGTMARVFFVIFFATSFGSIWRVARSMSAETTFAPKATAMFAVGGQVGEGQRISAPGLGARAQEAQWGGGGAGEGARAG